MGSNGRRANAFELNRSTFIPWDRPAIPAGILTGVLCVAAMRGKRMADQHEGARWFIDATRCGFTARQSLATSPAGGVIESQLNRALVRPMPLNRRCPEGE